MSDEFGLWELKSISVKQKVNSVAWVFPTLGTNEKLALAQIEAWKMQTEPSDLIIIATDAAPLIPIVSKLRGPVNLLERKEDTGAAGGFFSGQKWAFDRGYEKIMVTDDDAVPLSKNLIEGLSKALGDGALVSHAKHQHYGDCRANVAMCTMFHRSAFEKIGFSYAPYYMFWEDIELSNRIGAAGINSAYVGVFFDHPRPKVRPLSALFYLTRNQMFYYLYQKPNLLRFLNSAMFAFSLKIYFRRTGNPAGRLMKEAVEDAIHAKLLKKEFANSFPQECTSFSFSRPTADLDSSSSTLFGKIKGELSKKMPIKEKDITVFSANPLARLLRFARRLNREVVIFNELALTNLIMSRKIILYHEPSQKFYYYLENSSLQIVSNILSAGVFASLMVIRFEFNLLRHRFAGRKKYALVGFGLKRINQD